MRSVSLLLLGWLACCEASGEYLVSDSGRIVRYSDNGEYLGVYQVLVASYDPEMPDALLFTEPYFTTVVYGLALGPAGAGQSVYSVGNGSFGFFELGSFDAMTGLGGNRFVYNDPLDGGESPPLPLPQVGVDAVLQRIVSVDPSGDLWGFGRVRYQGPDPNPFPGILPDDLFPPAPVNYDVGWGVAKTSPTLGSLPEVVFQLLPSGQDQLFRSFSNPLSIEFAPDGVAFVSTEYGLIEFDPHDVPTLLSSTIDGAESLFDSSVPGSPFHADQPWMHPLLAGDMAGEWEYGDDGLLRLARESGSGQVELFTYNPTTRLLSDPRELPVLLPGESLHRKFFRPDGALMLWVRTDQTDNDGDRVYRLVEVDSISSTRVGVIFSASMLVANWGVLYVPTIPEPSSVVVLFSGLLAVGTRWLRRA